MISLTSNFSKSNNPRMKLVALVVVALAQLLFIFGLIFWNQVILSTGTPVRIRLLRPVDPPSLFRGNYITLSNYTISDINLSEVSHDDEKFRGNQRVWVTLAKEDGEEWWDATAVSGDKPKLTSGEVAIRGKTLYGARDSLRISYGIEQYFIPQSYEKEANRLLSGRVGEQRDRTAVVGAEVVVHSSGRARVKEVLIGGVALTDLMTGKATMEDIETEEIPPNSPWPRITMNCVGGKPQAAVSWSRVTRAASYDVHYCSDTTATCTPDIFYKNTVVPSAVHVGLDENMRYRYRVTAKTVSGISSESQIITASQKQCAPQPSFNQQTQQPTTRDYGTIFDESRLGQFAVFTGLVSAINIYGQENAFTHISGSRARNFRYDQYTLYFRCENPISSFPIVTGHILKIGYQPNQSGMPFVYAVDLRDGC